MNKKTDFIIGMVFTMATILFIVLFIVFAAAKCQKADGIACPKNDGYNIHIIEKGKALLF